MTPRKPEGKPRFQPTMVEFLMKTKENRDPGCYKLSQSFWAASQEASRCPNSDFWLPNSGLLPPIKLFIWKWQFSALRMVPPFMGSKQPLRASTAGGLEVSKTLGFYQGRGFDPSKTRRKTQILLRGTLESSRDEKTCTFTDFGPNEVSAHPCGSCGGKSRGCFEEGAALGPPPLEP